MHPLKWLFVTAIFTGQFALAIISDDGPRPGEACAAALVRRTEAQGEIVWRSPRPSDYLTFANDLLQGRRYPAGAEVKIIAENPGSQTTSAYGKKLISYSILNYPHGAAPEVAGVRYLYRSGQEIANVDNIQAGERDRLRNVTLADARFLRQNPVAMVVFEHTHPMYEIIVKDIATNTTSSLQFPLSFEDLSLAERYSREHPHAYLRLVAVLPNGYSYARTFLNGTSVVDPFPGR